MSIDLTTYSRRSTVRLTTTGRKSGKQHTVTVWFVVADARRFYVQHVQGATADWYKNLRKTPRVQIDFGDGPQPATATPILDPAEIQRVLALVRRKYWMAWFIQLFGRGKDPVAAVIEVGEAVSAY